LPFSDPIADGPVIQASARRALDDGVTVPQSFRELALIRSRHPDLPIGLLIYANLVTSRGIDRFYGECGDAGADSVLIADVPEAESLPFATAAAAAGIDHIAIVPPNATVDRTARIVARASGYTYVTTRAGVTGEGAPADRDLPRRVATIRELGAPPPLVGFGIASGTDARYAIDSGAAGVIVGSSLIRRILEDPDQVDGYLISLRAAIRLPTPIATIA
jgi:tryptophan synthase alpha chain